MKKVITFLEKFYYIVLMVFPFAFGIGFTIKELIEKRRVDQYVFPMLVFALIFCLAVFVLYRAKLEGKPRYLEIILFITALSIIFLYKYLLITYINAQPVNDFLEEYETAQRWNKLGHYPVGKKMVTYNMIWTGTMAFLFKLFGESVKIVQMYNIVVTILTGVFIYLTMKEGLKRFSSGVPYKRIAFMSMVLYGFWPGYTVYTGVLTNEHTGALFGTAALLFIVLGLSYYHISWKNTIIYSLLSGACLGIMNLYKPVMTIYFIAWGIVSLFFCINFVKENLNAEKNNFVALRCITALGISFLLASGINRAGVSFCEKISQTECADALMIWQRLYVGLDIEAKGHLYSSDYRQVKKALRDAGLSSEEIEQEFKRLVLENVKRDYKYYPLMFLEKTEKFLGGESAMYAHGTRISPSLEGERLEAAENVLAYNKLPLLNTMGVGYLIIFFFGLCGCIGMLRYRNPVCFVSTLVFFGFFLFLLLGENQNRYKASVYSEIAMASGMGTYIFYNTINKVCNLLRHKMSKDV